MVIIIGLLLVQEVQTELNEVELVEVTTPNASGEKVVNRPESNIQLNWFVSCAFEFFWTLSITLFSTNYGYFDIPANPA